MGMLLDLDDNIPTVHLIDQYAGDLGAENYTASAYLPGTSCI